MLLDEAFHILSEEVIGVIRPNFIGPKVVSRANPVEMGVSQVTIVEEEYVDDEVKIGNEGTPVPRSLGKLSKKTIDILEFSHGFRIYERDLEASKRGILPLPVSGAMDSGLKIAEALEDMIFNGNKEYNIKGIYKDAAKKHDANGKQWNSVNGDPYNDINKAVGALTRNSSYKPDFMILSPEAYTELTNANNYGISPMKLIKDAGLFDNGERIFRAPERANKNKAPIIPKNGGLIGAYGKNIAERYVQSVPNSELVGGLDNAYTDIYLQTPNKPNDDGNWNFTVKAYQGLDIHRSDAFVRLENLIS